MEQYIDIIKEWFTVLAPSTWLQALIVLIMSFFFAKLANWLLTKILKGIASSTKNELDDRFVELFHKPVIASIMMLGIGRAIYVLDIGVKITSFSISVLWTICIVYWMTFTLKFTRMSLTSMSGRINRFQMVQLHTCLLYTSDAADE